MSKEKIWDSLLQHKLLMEANVKSDKYKDAAVPCVLVQTSLSGIMTKFAESNEVSHQEVHDLRLSGSTPSATRTEKLTSPRCSSTLISLSAPTSILEKLENQKQADWKRLPTART